MKKKSIEAKDFDRNFENADDIIEYLNLDKVLRPKQEQKRVNVDFPIWMIQQLDKEARKLGVTRQSIIKIWLAERLKETTI